MFFICNYADLFNHFMSIIEIIYITYPNREILFQFFHLFFYIFFFIGDDEVRL